MVHLLIQEFGWEQATNDEERIAYGQSLCSVRSCAVICTISDFSTENRFVVPIRLCQGMEQWPGLSQAIIGTCEMNQPRTASSNPIKRLQFIVIRVPSATENSQLVNEAIEMSRSSPRGTSTTSSNFAPIQHLESVVTPAAT
jgi:hypothetical protein